MFGSVSDVEQYIKQNYKESDTIDTRKLIAEMEKKGVLSNYTKSSLIKYGEKISYQQLQKFLKALTLHKETRADFSNRKMFSPFEQIINRRDIKVFIIDSTYLICEALKKEFNETFSGLLAGFLSTGHAGHKEHYPYEHTIRAITWKEKGSNNIWIFEIQSDIYKNLKDFIKKGIMDLSYYISSDGTMSFSADAMSDILNVYEEAFNKCREKLDTENCERHANKTVHKKFDFIDKIENYNPEQDYDVTFIFNKDWIKNNTKKLYKIFEGLYTKLIEHIYIELEKYFSKYDYIEVMISNSDRIKTIWEEFDPNIIKIIYEDMPKRFGYERGNNFWSKIINQGDYQLVSQYIKQTANADKIITSEEQKVIDAMNRIAKKQSVQTKTNPIGWIFGSIGVVLAILVTILIVKKQKRGRRRK